jgi:hypothetical protein
MGGPAIGWKPRRGGTMNEVRFLAVVGDDQVIRPPAGVLIPGGEVEVTVRTTVVAAPSSEEEDVESLRDWLLGLAKEAEAIEGPPLPSDMAENHDHYAHGKPLP